MRRHSRDFKFAHFSIPVLLGIAMTIGALAGPVGWAALAGAVVYTAGRPDKEKLFRGVTAISAVRQRLLYELKKDRS